MERNELLSDQELQFTWWLDALQQKGIVNKYYYESNTFTLSTAKQYPLIKKTVRKTSIVSHELLKAHIYTPDFLVEWNEDWDGIFYREILAQKYTTKPPFYAVRSTKNNKPYTFFEVKADFDRENMTRLFKISQKWLYDSKSIYVDLVLLPQSLFKKTFTPDRYLFTDKTKAPRKINFSIRRLDDYIAQLKSQEFKQIEIL